MGIRTLNEKPKEEYWSPCGQSCGDLGKDPKKVETHRGHFLLYPQMFPWLREEKESARKSFQPIGNKKR
jgi:hypothetical protein